jgi:transcriptional regulator with XRE-family HTH domain
MARTNFSDLHKEVTDHPGAKERLAAKRTETLEEIRLYQLRHSETVCQAELAGRLDVTQGAISKLEHSEDVRVSTLRQYLEALGARLELVAVFDDEDRRGPHPPRQGHRRLSRQRWRPNPTWLAWVRSSTGGNPPRCGSSALAASDSGSRPKARYQRIGTWPRGESGRYMPGEGR